MRKLATCAIVGDEPLVAQCADVARSHGLDVVLIATSNELVKDYARERGIPVVASGVGLVGGIVDHPADVLLSIANLRLVPDEVLDRVSVAINFHDGPLPDYAGLNVTTWALLAGETEHAVTWHLMTSDVDAGEIVATERFAVASDETAFSLNARCYEAALTTFPQIAAALASGELRTAPQPAGTRRVFKRHDRPAILFDPRRPSGETARAVRALDLGPRLRNSIGSVRWVASGDVVVFDSTKVADVPSGATPGTIVELAEGGPRIATSDGDVVVTGASTPEGVPISGEAWTARFGFVPGQAVTSPDPALVEALTELEPVFAKHERYWLDRLVAHPPTVMPDVVDASQTTAGFDPGGASPGEIVAAFSLWLSRATGSGTVTFEITDDEIEQVVARTSPLTRRPVAVVDVESVDAVGQLVEHVEAELADVRSRSPLLRDALGRDPRTRGRDLRADVRVVLGDTQGDAPSAAADSPALQITIGARVVLHGRVGREDPGFVERAAEQIDALVRSLRAGPAGGLASLDMLGPTDRAVMEAINDTGVEHDRGATISRLFHAAAAATPERPAVSFGTQTLTYAQLEDRVGELAHRLAAAGVGHGSRVGVAVPRSIEMLVGVLATLDLGAAYVPLDPTYPLDRLRFMVEDSGLEALLATGSTAHDLARPAVAVVDPMAGADVSERARAVDYDPAELAYVIYTSGSTGTPKGVMLEHRAVVNFFVAMDRVIDVDDGGVWLAVTSLSFDISVLELLWTVTRGFHVVIKSDRDVQAVATPAVRRGGDSALRPVSFSLFYFAAGEEAASDGYRLLLESARFADANGFEAVWTPERHFHAFGGAYPNPSVTGAALAAVTENVAIRAGSVVLPLHSPVRVAEEWAIVDNISRGRVGISFAAGWQPNDFVLNPGAYKTAKDDLPRSIELVQRLWRGEKVALPGHDGEPVDVRTLPRPVQSDLPTWLTSAGSPATFERAGRLGVNVLTHLLGQSVEQLAENVDRYRTAWREAGHPGEGRVTLMLHTYLDRDSDVAKEVAREPMKSYLGTAVGLLRDVASAFPTFAGRGKDTDDLFKTLTPEELDQLLEVAAQRYLGTSGLFGTPDDVARVVEDVAAAGVDEVACLVDFGVATDDVLRSLDLLLEAKQLVEDRRRAAATVVVPTDAAPEESEPESVAALVARHGVTHLQCTPSLAAMLLADPDDRVALSTIRHLMLGGEALASALAAELRELLPGRFTNMYGPTETTIWSLTHELDAPIGSTIPIGRPIANTTVFVLGPDGGRLGVGMLGELHIGGESVARGYHNRPELTAERFVERPGMGRVYATGDVVRIHPAGYVEFVGRADHQVKIRGHRIELGEIETVIDRHPDVVQSVVVAREDTGDTRLVAYAVLQHGVDFAAETIRKHVAEVLPDVMVPSVVVPLDAFPLTPNGKIDRKALPAPRSSVEAGAPAAMSSDLERLVAGVWTAELDRSVGRDDNFFEIGGHSLLAVKVFRRLSDEVNVKIALTDIFRFPTVRAFAAHLGALQGVATDDGGRPVAAPAGSDRGAMRRRAMARRSGIDEASRG